MPPAKENDLSFPSPLAPPSSACPPTLKPLSSMYRLPLSIVPSNYNIQVSFNIPDRSYQGRVITNLSILSPSQHICLNSINLELSNIVIVSEDTAASVKGFVADSNKSIGVIRIDFGHILQTGNYRLQMNFKGKIRVGLQGVYLNKFVDAGGVEQDGVATMFAATDARSFFPCWDQPDMKCSFELTVLVDKSRNYTVLSNMNQTDSDDVMDDDVIASDAGVEWSVHKFSRSPSMSTYLLCFVIGQYSAVSQQVGQTRVSVYAPVNRSEEATFSLDTGVKCLQIFNDFFGVDYCLPKLDLIALACLSVGAMENWGLVTFRENSLLVERTTSSNAQFQAVATIVAHEISHQWFGKFTSCNSESISDCLLCR